MNGRDAARAIDALRRGWPFRVTGPDGALDLLAVESARDAALARLTFTTGAGSDPLLAVLHPIFPGFLPELIRSAATTNALGQFWRVMSDLFLDLRRADLAAFEIGKRSDRLLQHKVVGAEPTRA